jgi:hypothetical protein
MGERRAIWVWHCHQLILGRITILSRFSLMGRGFVFLFPNGFGLEATAWEIA